MPFSVYFSKEYFSFLNRIVGHFKVLVTGTSLRRDCLHFTDMQIFDSLLHWTCLDEWTHPSMGCFDSDLVFAAFLAQND